ncbi:MAG: nuclear transport factor 2 family protein [Deinococcales bacterium]|jgi:uncharacterized protein (TIGR02246 family)
MIRRFTLCLLATLGLMAVVGATAQSAGGDVQADQAAIRQVWVDYAHYAETGNLEGWMALWMPGGIKMSAGKPPIVGLDAIRSATGVGKSSATVVLSIDPQEITVIGDWAYTWGLYTKDVTPEGGGATSHVDGKFMTILRRQDDGSWRIYRDIDNSNVPSD